MCMTLNMEGDINCNKNSKEIKRKGQSALAQRPPEACGSSHHDRASVTTRRWQLHHMTSSSVRRTVQPDGGRSPHLQTNHLRVPVCLCVTWQSLLTVRLQPLTLWSHNFPLTFPVHLARAASVGPPISQGHFTRCTERLLSYTKPSRPCSLLLPDPSLASPCRVSFLSVEAHFLCLFCLPCPQGQQRPGPIWADPALRRQWARRWKAMCQGSPAVKT